MAHWLFKSEPTVFSYEKLAGEGVAIEPLLANETKAQYEERIAALDAEASAPGEPPVSEDGAA